MSACRFQTPATSTWIFVPFFHRWANTSWPSSTRWRLWSWFKTSWSLKWAKTVRWMMVIRLRGRTWARRQWLGFPSSPASLRTALSSCASLTTTSQSSKSSWSSTRPLSIHTPKRHSLHSSTLEICTQWRRTWTRSWRKRLRKLPLSSRKPCPKDKIATERVCQWQSLSHWLKRQISNELSNYTS